MHLHLARAGVGRAIHQRSFSIRRVVDTERLFWWTLIGLGILGMMIYVGLFGIMLWGLFWGVSL